MSFGASGGVLGGGILPTPPDRGQRKRVVQKLSAVPGTKRRPRDRKMTSLCGLPTKGAGRRESATASLSMYTHTLQLFTRCSQSETRQVAPTGRTRKRRHAAEAAVSIAGAPPRRSCRLRCHRPHPTASPGENPPPRATVGRANFPHRATSPRVRTYLVERDHLPPPPHRPTRPPNPRSWPTSRGAHPQWPPVPVAQTHCPRCCPRTARRCNPTTSWMGQTCRLSRCRCFHSTS